MNNKKYVSAVMAITMMGTLAVALPALADTTPAPSTQPGAWGGRGGQGGAMMRPVVVGTVSAVNGNTLTVNGKQGIGQSQTTTTFTVDATNAKVMKNKAAGTVASIVVGDTVVVQGTVNGSSVTATMIRDGIMMRNGPGMRGEKKSGNEASSTLPIVGNGQPVVAGAVTAISGSTLTVTNKSNVTYTVDATNAKILQGQNTVAISNVTVGDNVIIQGAVNGNSITASTVIDQMKQPAGTPAPGTGNGQNGGHGFLGGIGQFFAHLFGF